MRSFEKLEVWQRSCDLAVEVCQHFRDCNNYALRDQLMRSTILILQKEPSDFLKKNLFNF